MIGRVAALIYGVASYLVFVCSLLYAVAFIGNYLVPKSIDVGSVDGLAKSVLINVALLGLFAVQHSVMARPAFKRWWTTIVPVSCETPKRANVTIRTVILNSVSMAHTTSHVYYHRVDWKVKCCVDFYIFPWRGEAKIRVAGERASNSSCSAV